MVHSTWSCPLGGFCHQTHCIWHSSCQVNPMHCPRASCSFNTWNSCFLASRSLCPPIIWPHSLLFFPSSRGIHQVCATLMTPDPFSLIHVSLPFSLLIPRGNVCISHIRFPFLGMANIAFCWVSQFSCCLSILNINVSMFATTFLLKSPPKYLFIFQLHRKKINHFTLCWEKGDCKCSQKKYK